MKPKDAMLLLFILLLTVTLIFLSNWTPHIVVFEPLSKPINKQIVYQSITLCGAVIFLLILRRAKQAEFQTYFRKGEIAADIRPEPLLGISPKNNQNWWHFGRNFSIVISVATATVIYFQLVVGKDITVNQLLNVMPFCIVFALTNAFVEESITRLGVVVVLKNTIKIRWIPIISGVIFGTAHYWGNPGGFFGVLMAGFLGWLLAKSILETKGIFWAWFIHFLQDIIIFSALLTMS